MPGWDFQWGELWGSGTPWGQTDDDGAPLPIYPGDLDTLTTAQNRLWRQFMLDEDGWRALFAAIADAFGDVESVCSQAHLQRFVATAAGANLDRIGELVNLPRAGTTDDDDYRLAIIAEATSLVVSGTPYEVIDLAIRLAPAGSQVAYFDLPPAFFVVSITGLTGPRFDLIRRIMADVPPAGVGARLQTYDPARTAGWGSTRGPAGSGSWGSTRGDAPDALSLWSHHGEIG